MKPYLSVIIPYYNAPEKLERLVRSIAKSKNAPPFEVIVVDDGSAKAFMVHGSWFIEKIKKLRTTNYQLRTVRLSTNKGPAIARNRGVEKAKGEFVVFLDGDVEVFADTLFQIGKVFSDDKDVVALTGVWVKEQKSKDFFPNFKALRDWSYWINERDKSGYYFLFSTRIAAIKKAVFMRLGGFDETYPAPLVEDIELTYRIARRYAILFAPQVRVRHEFEGFSRVAKKYFLRAYYWTKLYTRRKKFDPVATTLQEALTTLSGVGVVVTTVVGFMGLISRIRLVEMIGIVLGVMIVLHLLFVKKFLVFVLHEKGWIFMLKSFLTGLLLYCFIFAGVVFGRFFSEPMVHDD